mmetsp:Transcript_30610/g.70632  ORF Transcript_30610/g.70632 Transcript_30610/m.70632 type:complete len:288 (+) Transcript_30610:544-1407(+)
MARSKGSFFNSSEGSDSQSKEQLEVEPPAALMRAELMPALSWINGSRLPWSVRTTSAPAAAAASPAAPVPDPSSKSRGGPFVAPRASATNVRLWKARTPPAAQTAPPGPSSKFDSRQYRQSSACRIRKWTPRPMGSRMSWWSSWWRCSSFLASASSSVSSPIHSSEPSPLAWLSAFSNQFAASSSCPALKWARARVAFPGSQLTFAFTAACAAATASSGLSSSRRHCARASWCFAQLGSACAARAKSSAARPKWPASAREVASAANLAAHLEASDSMAGPAAKLFDN